MQSHSKPTNNMFDLHHRAGTVEQDNSTPHDLDRYFLLWLVDDGSDAGKYGYQVVKQGHHPDPTKTELLKLPSSNSSQAPQKVGFIRDCGVWQLWCGGSYERKMSSQDRPSEEDVREISNIKAALFGNDSAWAVREHIRNTLVFVGVKDHDVDWLEALEWLKVRVLESLRKELETALRDHLRNSVGHFARWTAMQVLAMDQVTFIGVPEAATVESNGWLMRMARKAGFSHVELVSEAEAGTAWVAHRLRDNRELLPDIKDGDVILSVDVGGFSDDTAGFRVRGLVSEGARLDLESIGRRHGGVWGASKLNDMALDHVETFFNETEIGGYDGMMQRTGWAARPDQFRRKVLSYFQTPKKDVLSIEEDYTFVVRGLRPGQGAEITFERELICSWVRECFNHHLAAIEDVTKVRPKAIIVLGGFYRNAYLIELMKEYCDSRRIRLLDLGTNDTRDTNTCVILGMGARYSVRAVDEPFQSGFLVNEEVYYDRSKHRNIKLGSSMVIVNADGEPYLEDRVRFILKPRTLINPRKSLSRKIWNCYYVPDVEGARHVEKQVYWTNRTDINDGVPIFTGEQKDGQKQLRPGVEVFTGCASAHIDADQLRKYPVVPFGTAVRAHYTVADDPDKDDTDVAMHKVWTCIEVVVKGQNVNIAWYRAPHTWSAQCDRSKFPPDHALIPMSNSPVHDAKFNPFVRRQTSKHVTSQEASGTVNTSAAAAINKRSSAYPSAARGFRTAAVAEDEAEAEFIPDQDSDPDFVDTSSSSRKRQRWKGKRKVTDFWKQYGTRASGP
ncbi:hypothetical protein LTR37_001630 [Vermiconidia calcicola]|uniref:Uncharacterized protein n=1 Tax=Vermiconidia calcicola TaxID=1690605 RepID=A0ACC3NV88_9PEZI|nr:hypothetical protein LTR37_001630 [Vermiconidia calcicola]